jgi:hypothetical protein
MGRHRLFESNGEIESVLPLPFAGKGLPTHEKCTKKLFSHFYCIPLLIKILADLVKVKPKKEVFLQNLFSIY